VGLARREKTAPLFSVSVFDDVEKILDSRALVCDCGGILARWGWGIPRKVRGIERVIIPRRTRCLECRVTHILLPSDCLLRRADSALIIGRGLVAAAGGAGFGKVAGLLNLARETVRGWFQATKQNAGIVIAMFTAIGLRADPSFLTRQLTASDLAAVVDTALRAAAALVLGVGTVSEMAPWLVISQVSNGLLLSPGIAGGLPTRVGPYARDYSLKR